MATMSLDNELKLFWPQLANEEKQSILSQIRAFLQQKSVPLERLTIEEYNRLQKEAEADINNGAFFTQEEVKEMSKQW